MAPNRTNKEKKVAVSFDEMIQADRKKRKAEELAQRIMGKNRKDSTPSAGNNRSAGGSLASRVGVTKTQSQSRSSSVANDGRRQNNRNPRPSFYNTAIATASSSPAVVQLPGQKNRQNNATFSAPEINIRGAAGPYCVVASNFAPGTTAADIESVMIPVGGEMLSCRLISSNPTVIVEMVFSERSGADNVISMFNNKKADGRILYVYMKEGGPSHPINIQSSSSSPALTRPVQPVAVAPHVPSPRPVQQPADEIMEVDPDSIPAEDIVYDNNNAISDIDVDATSSAQSHSASRATDPPRAPREPYRPSYRDDYNRAPGHPDFERQDGRYGFHDQQYPRRGDSYGGGGYRNDRRGGRFRDEGRMYSDSMIGRGGGGGGGRYRR